MIFPGADELRFNPSLTIGLQIAEPIHQHRGHALGTGTDHGAPAAGEGQIPDAAKRRRPYRTILRRHAPKRAMIAMALACQPRLIIADEPTRARRDGAGADPRPAEGPLARDAAPR